MRSLHSIGNGRKLRIFSRRQRRALIHINLVREIRTNMALTLSRSSNLAQPACTVARSQGTPLAKGAKASSNDFELQYQRALCLLPAGYLETPRHVGTALANRVGAVVSRRRGVLVVFARELAPWKIYRCSVCAARGYSELRGFASCDNRGTKSALTLISPL